MLEQGDPMGQGYKMKRESEPDLAWLWVQSLKPWWRYPGRILAGAGQGVLAAPTRNIKGDRWKGSDQEQSPVRMQQQ